MSRLNSSLGLPFIKAKIALFILLFAFGGALLSTLSGQSTQIAYAAAIPAGCPGSQIQGPPSVNCGSIPLGCPGSTQQGPVTQTPTNCPYEPATAASPTTTPAPPNGDDLTCESNGNPLNWILCPVFNIVAGFADFLFSALINPFLVTAPIDTTGTSPIYKIWSAFRIYGNIFLIIALLVIVFGQSIGGGVLDAYTAKKVLPRLLAASILINISIYVVAFMVDITNIVGGGLGSIITAPLGDAGAFKISPSGIEAGTIIGASAVGLVAGSTAIIAALTTTAGASFIAIAVLLPAALGLLAAVVTLVLRQGIIIALVIVSPVAFALYCLPNTEKYFKQWWSTLVKALVVYPIIVMIFAVANVLAFTSTAANNGAVAGSLSLVVAFLLQFIPLLMIPFAFRLAGGAIGKIGDLATGATVKGTNMAKNRREQAGFRFKQAKAGRASQVNTAFNNSRLGGVVGSTPGLSRLQGRRGQRLDILNRNLSADVGKTPGAQAIQHDDDAIRAATYSSYGAAVKGMQDEGFSEEQAVRGAQAASASIGFGRSQAIWATEAMGRTGTSFTSLEDQARTIARASGGDRSTIASLAGNLNSVNKQVGRMELAPSFGNLNMLAQAEAGNQSFEMKDENGNVQQITPQEAYSRSTRAAWNSADLGTLVRGKDSTQTKRFADHFVDRLHNGTAKERKDAAIALTEMQSALPQASGGNQKVILDALGNDRANGGAGIQFGSGPIHEQLSAQLNTGPSAVVVPPEEILARARVYNQDTPLGQRTQPPPAAGGGGGGQQ